MTNYNSSGGQGQQRPLRKPKINVWEGEGIVRSRSANADEPIRFFPFKNGGGAIHISLLVTESFGAGADGAPRTRTTYIPVNVTTNNGSQNQITPQQLQSVRPGMKVRVVGRLGTETYDSKRTGQKVTSLVVDAFVFEILDIGQVPAYPQQGGALLPHQGAGHYPPASAQGYGFQGGAPAPFYGQNFPQQNAPVYPQQQPYPQPAPMPPYPGGYAPGAGIPQPAQPQHPGAVPPYYHPPAVPAPAPPATPQGAGASAGHPMPLAPGIEDLPPDMPV